MEQDKEKTAVIFRKFKDGDIIAIFPELVGTDNLGTCMSYQHIGQHGSCDLGIIYDTKLATDEEYKDLKDELEHSIGYNLRVIKKATRKHFKIREAELNRFKNVNKVSK